MQTHRRNPRASPLEGGPFPRCRKERATPEELPRVKAGAISCGRSILVRRHYRDGRLQIVHVEGWQSGASQTIPQSLPISSWLGTRSEVELRRGSIFDRRMAKYHPGTRKLVIKTSLPTAEYFEISSYTCRIFKT